MKPVRFTVSLFLKMLTCQWQISALGYGVCYGSMLALEMFDNSTCTTD